MPKGNLRDRLDGNELDLSMDSLSVVPVKEMATIPRATHVDLSCNLLTSLPDVFCTLTHLVQLDLSKNQLDALPEAFGELSRLQHLDLYDNKLTSLPVSCFKLRHLRYLDVKNNPLKESLLRVTGDCLDDLQCKRCAQQVVAFMKEVNSEQERRRQKELQRQRELDAAQRQEAEREKQRVKAAKQALKDQRRQDYLARQAQLTAGPDEGKEAQADEAEERVTANGVDNSTRIPVEKSGVSRCGLVLALLVLTAAVVAGLAFYCDQNPKLYLQAVAEIHRLVNATASRLS